MLEADATYSACEFFVISKPLFPICNGHIRRIKYDI